MSGSDAGGAGWWERLASGRRSGTVTDQPPAPTDKEGARLYLQYQDCLSQHKHHVFYAVGAVVIPWSYFRKSIGPFAIGMMTALVPDLLYANWRCDAPYKAFVHHCNQVARAIQEKEQQQQTSQRQVSAKH